MQLFPHFTSADGKCLACTYRVKFIEVSVGINHNVDELLAGCLTQIRLKKEHNLIQVGRRARISRAVLVSLTLHRRSLLEIALDVIRKLILLLSGRSREFLCALVQKQKCSTGEHESTANAYLDPGQGGLQVQEL